MATLPAHAECALHAEHCCGLPSYPPHCTVCRPTQWFRCALAPGARRTANLMTWFVFEMARNEVIQRRLCAEVDALFDTMIDAHSRTERLMAYRPALDNAVSTTAQQNHTQCNMPSREAQWASAACLPARPPACLPACFAVRYPVRLSDACRSARARDMRARAHARSDSRAAVTVPMLLWRHGALALAVDPLFGLGSQWHRRYSSGTAGTPTSRGSRSSRAASWRRCGCGPPCRTAPSGR